MYSNLWKEKKFKELNLDAMGTMPEGGHLHPLLKVRTEIRKIFLEMGYIIIHVCIGELEYDTQNT